MLTNAPWMISMLDQFHLERSGTVVARFYDRKPDLVLAYMALHRDRPVSRLELATALWPDRDPAVARSRLSECLHYMKRDLAAAGVPTGCITGNRHVVDLSQDIDTDVRQFENAVAGAVTAKSPDRQMEFLEQALTIYGDGLLPGFTHAWLADERERLAAVHGTAARQLAHSLAAAGAFDATPEFAEHMAPEDLTRQWIRSRRLTDATPVRQRAVHDAARPWIPGASLDELERRLAARAVAIAEQAEPHLWGPERPDWLARLDADYDDIMAALRWAIETEDRDTALALSSALWPYWQARGRVADGRKLAEMSLSVGTAGSSTADAKAVHAAGVLALVDGDLSAAEDRLIRARDLWIELDEATWLGRCLNSICVLAYRRCEYAAAREHARQATDILGRPGNDSLLVRTLKDAALVEIADGQLDRADELLHEALELSASSNNVAAEARILGDLSTVAQHRELWDDARLLSERAITMLAGEDDLEGVAFCLRSLGHISAESSDPAQAQTHFSDSLRLSRVLGDAWAAGQSLQYLAELAVSRERPESAKDLYEQSLPLFERAGDEHRALAVQAALADLATESGD
jgi:DNA-binding SARP family transcriptional activator